MKAMNDDVDIDSDCGRNRNFPKSSNHSVSDEDDDQNFDDTFFQTEGSRGLKRKHKGEVYIDPI